MDYNPCKDWLTCSVSKLPVRWHDTLNLDSQHQSLWVPRTASRKKAGGSLELTRPPASPINETWTLKEEDGPQSRKTHPHAYPPVHTHLFAYTHVHIPTWTYTTYVHTHTHARVLVHPNRLLLLYVYKLGKIQFKEDKHRNKGFWGKNDQLPRTIRWYVE